MRFVPVMDIKEGMELFNSLYSLKGDILLKQGTKLSSRIIEKVKELGYNGIYVKDTQIENIEVQEHISYPLRMQMSFLYTTMLDKIKKNINPKDEMDKIKKLSNDIIDELSAHKDLMVNSIDIKLESHYLAFHSVQVAILSGILGLELGLNKKELYELVLAALFHDIGKAQIEGATSRNWDEKQESYQSHTQKGYLYLKENQIVPTRAYVAVLSHHEKYDGTGFPNQKKKDHIDLFARIISVADTYDKLSSKDMSPSEAMEYIMGASDSLFDPDIVMLFSRKVAPYPIGTYVELSNEETGVVIENYKEYCMRPKLMVFKKQDKKITPQLVDLIESDYNNVTIRKIVS